MKTALAAALLIALTTGLSQAQSNTGTSLGTFLLIEPSARYAGMGNAGVATAEGLQSVYFNPAAIGLVGSYGVEFTHCAWLADISYQYAAAAIPAGHWGNVFASLTALSSGDMDVRTVEQPLGTGEKFSVTDVALGLGYGRRITDRFSAGIQLNYVQETIWHSSVATATLTLGTLYEISPTGLHIGAAIQNFGVPARFTGRDLQITYDNTPGVNGDNSQLPGEIFTDDFGVPVLFRVGLGMPFQLGKNVVLNCEADAIHPSENSESLNLGAELAFQKNFMLRVGHPNLGQKDSEEGFALGAGYQGKTEDYNYHVEYAWEDHGRLDHTSRISLGLSF